MASSMATTSICEPMRPLLRNCSAFCTPKSTSQKTSVRIRLATVLRVRTPMSAQKQ